jgi:hypothetical protein
MIFIIKTLMKIKITEGQANRIGILKEGLNPLIHFENLAKTKIELVNRLYVSVINSSIGEIMNNNIDISDINRLLSDIESEIYDGSKKATDYINMLPDEGLDVRADQAHDSVIDKITSLSLILMDLENLQDTSVKHKLLDSFKDTAPIDITDIQT